MPDNPIPPVSRDVQAGELRARFPGWHIWFVVSATQRTANWHATPGRFPLNAASPAELAASIEADPCSAGQGWPGLRPGS